MNCRKFLKHDFFLPARFVFEQEGEQEKETLAEPGVPKDVPANPTDAPSDAEVAKRRQSNATRAEHDAAQNAEALRNEAALQGLDAAQTNPPDAAAAPGGVPEPAPSDDAGPSPIPDGAEVPTNAPAATPPAKTPTAPETFDHSDAAVTAILKKYADKPETEIASDADPILEYARADITDEESKKALEKAQGLLKPEWDKQSIVAALPTPSEIDKLADDKKIDYREARALREKLKVEVDAGREIPRVTEDELTKFKEKMGIKDKEPSWLTGGGMIATLMRAFTKLFEGLGKLMKMAVDQLGKLFGSDEKLPEHYAKSPIDGNGKFLLIKVANGVDLKGDRMGAAVVSVTAGKVDAMGTNDRTITIKSSDGTKIIYTNLDPDSSLAVGTDIAEGATLGKLTGDTLNFQIKNKEDQQLDSTTLLATYTKPADAPAAAPNPAPTAALSPAPATAPTAGPIAAPTKPPEKTHADLDKELIAKTNENLKKYAGQTVDLKTKDFSFPLPYIEGQEIKMVMCTIRGNTFKVGDNVYEMALPHAADLQSIKIEGTAQSGTAEITAGKLIFSDTRQVELKELLAHLNTLRSGPASDSIQVGQDTATLTRKT